MQYKPWRKILILGASGFIGRVLSECLGNQQCLGTYNSSRETNEGIRFNILTDSLSSLDFSGISHAVVLFGMTSPDQCANDLKLSEAVNIRGIKSVVDGLGERQIPFVFASTEVVFDGLKGAYVESDPPNPILSYGRQKLVVEQYISEKFPFGASIRVAKVYGTRPGDKSLLDNWRQQIWCGGDVRCAADFVSSVVHVDDVVNAILAIFSRGLSGIYHVGGPKGISRHNLFLTLLEAMKAKHRLPPIRVVSCSIDDFDTVEKRPKNISLNSNRIVKDTGISFRSFEDCCHEYVDQI